MGTFRQTIEIGDPQGRRYERVEALVDTGASYTTLPASLLRKLGVEPYEDVEFHVADGRRVVRSIGQTWIRIEGRRVMTIVVFGDEGASPLLGAYSLEGLRLDVDPTNRRLVRTPGLLM
ncbi:MAG: aspartyl protease family protein [Chloroflexi bacterium]|nr:aspartyl protease family protein [Chloroflexota bacterium]